MDVPARSSALRKRGRVRASSASDQGLERVAVVLGCQSKIGARRSASGGRAIWTSPARLSALRKRGRVRALLIVTKDLNAWLLCETHLSLSMFSPAAMGLHDPTGPSRVSQ